MAGRQAQKPVGAALRISWKPVLGALVTAVVLGAVADWFETNATCVDSQNTQPDQLRRAWQVLQISRTDGVLRFHVNGRLARLTRLAGGLRNVEGIYFPDALPRLRRYFRIKRRFAGLANEGVYLDFFHRAQRRV